MPATADHNPELQVYRSLDHRYRSRTILCNYVSQNNRFDFVTISLLIITYYHHLNLVSDQVQVQNMFYLHFYDIILKLINKRKVSIAALMDLSIILLLLLLLKEVGNARLGESD